MTIKTLVAKYLKSVGIAAKRSELGLNFSYDCWNFLLWNDKEFRKGYYDLQQRQLEL